MFSFVQKFCYLFNTSPELDTKVSFFSDSIVLSSSDFSNLIIPISIAEGYVKSELGLLFRGGITKGSYYHKDGVTFGPAVVSAYRLESLANYSRILIDNMIVDENDDSIEIFQDIDGRYCLNLSALIIYNNTQSGGDRAHFSDGDPVDILTTNFRDERKAILDAIQKHMGTAVVEKYSWRIRPYNFTCAKLADHPEVVNQLISLSQPELDRFAQSVHSEMITNADLSFV